jgi:hypothetical protein
MTVHLPHIVLALGLSAQSSSGEVVRAPGPAQARLAEALADAESIDSVVATGDHVTFAIDRAHDAYRVDVTTRRHQIVGLEIHYVGPEPSEHGKLTWLSRELSDVHAVRRLRVDDEGTVTLDTDDGRSYLAIPDRHDGNTAVEARWGAAWNGSDDDERDDQPLAPLT